MFPGPLESLCHFCPQLFALMVIRLLLSFVILLCLPSLVSVVIFCAVHFLFYVCGLLSLMVSIQCNIFCPIIPDLCCVFLLSCVLDCLELCFALDYFQTFILIFKGSTLCFTPVSHVWVCNPDTFFCLLTQFSIIEIVSFCTLCFCLE